MIQKIRDRITKEIVESPLSISEIARLIGVKQPTASAYVHQKALPALDTLARLCKVLEVSADYILGLENYSGEKTIFYKI